MAVTTKARSTLKKCGLYGPSMVGTQFTTSKEILRIHEKSRLLLNSMLKEIYWLPTWLDI